MAQIFLSLSDFSSLHQDAHHSYICSRHVDIIVLSLEARDNGETEFELDQYIIKRVVEIQSLTDEDRSHILYTLDVLLQNVRTKMTFVK